MNMDASLAPWGRNPIHIHLPGGLPGGSPADHPNEVVVDKFRLRVWWGLARPFARSPVPPDRLSL